MWFTAPDDTEPILNGETSSKPDIGHGCSNRIGSSSSSSWWLIILTILFAVAIVVNIHFQWSTIFSPTAPERLCRTLNGWTSGKETATIDFNVIVADVFLEHSDAPELPVNGRHVPPVGQPYKCSHHSCFDLYRCGLVSYQPYVPTETAKDYRRKSLATAATEERIKVYVYPAYKFVKRKTETASAEVLNKPPSLEFFRMLAAIVSSRYFTSEPSDACLFIPNLDLLNFPSGLSATTNLELMLWSLPYFRTMNGSNHLLFVMMADQNRHQIGESLNRVMVARGGSSPDFRLNFDVAMPVYSVLSRLYENTDTLEPFAFDVMAVMELKRTWTVLSLQLDDFLQDEERSEVLMRLESFYSNRMVLFGRKGCTGSARRHRFKLAPILPFLNHQNVSSEVFQLYNQSYVCNHDRRIVHRYLDVLHRSEFCLILPTTNRANLPLLSETLMSGCIPVIVDDNFAFPFAEKIDWTTISVRIREHSLADLLRILDAVSADRRRQLRLMGLNIWNRYFRTVENISLTVLDIINERVYPRQKIIHTVDPDGRFHEIRPRSFEFFAKGFSYICPKSLNLISDGFTTVVLTYNRPESLFRVVASMARVASCRKILVIWNDPLREPPGGRHWPTVSTPVQVIKMKQNRLSNRFYPYASIETEAVFAIDDDITMLNEDEIEFAYQTWREFPDRIVGFPSRLHYWNNLTHSWSYDSEWKNRISLILTGAAFYHQYYNYLYTKTLPGSIRDWVDDHMNCEDIAMNFLVSNVTGKAPIKVTPRKKFKCPECGNRSNSLSADVLRHLKLRSECVDRFAAIYKMMPLKAVEFRSDPVLFRDNIPDKFKHFSGIGNL